MKAAFLFVVVAISLTTTTFAESPPVTVTIGSVRVSLRPPCGFAESSRATPFLSRFFSALIAPDQIQLGGYLTDKEAKYAQSGAEPLLWHVACAYSITRFKDDTLSISDFSEIRRNFRENIEQAVQLSADRGHETILRLGGIPSGRVTSHGIFRDNANSFAYLAKISDGRARINAIGFVLVRGKIVGLSINKVWSSEVDTEWTKAAMKWWMDQIRNDNP